MVDQQQELRERSIPELMKQLSEETATLVRQEVELAKAELTDKAKRGGLGAGALGAAGLVGLYALAARPPASSPPWHSRCRSGRQRSS